MPKSSRADSEPSTQARRADGGLEVRAARYVYTRAVSAEASPAQTFEPIRRIGGDTGWYYADWLWRLRGALDLMIGGNGFRKGRNDPDQLKVAETVDCMRVLAIEPDSRLLFAVEMKLGGGAFLEFTVEGEASLSVVRLTAFYDPEGIIGKIYWYMSYPLHLVVFRGLLERIVELAEGAAKSSPELNLPA